MMAHNPSNDPLQGPPQQQQPQMVPQQRAPHQQPHELGHVEPKNGFISWNNHNPFDVNSYPITNPPIIDSTFFLPYTNEQGVQRRRRISISNGQIGQIINHEALYADDDSYDELSDLPFKPPHQQQQQQQPQQQLQSVDPGQPLVSEPRMLPYEIHGVASQSEFLHRSQHPSQGPKMEESKPDLHLQAPSQPPGTISGQHGPPGQPTGPLPPHHDISGTFPTSAHPPPPHSEHQPLRSDSAAPHPRGDASMAGERTPRSSSHLEDVAGVPPPNHQLIYNNEVIYSADGGPIPGTAAWKKERLLERNRIAASKCRQRKKQAQQQLQNNISKYEREMKEQRQTLDRYEKLLEIYNKSLGEYFTGDNTSIDKLRPYVGKSIDELDL
ncbi:hypothetical protein B9J08_03520 [Candidozyma auris]|uniref:BZIP domain-containing protein n=1 Tax=Candidozyma auris TaxID=498019 RepID=A0A2H1A1H8_CANAR|nr:hypothetical protein B9J08_001270 [[Candida] auris]